MPVYELKDVIFKNYYKRIVFVKERNCYSVKRLKKENLLLLSNKSIENIPDSCNAKEQ